MSVLRLLSSVGNSNGSSSSWSTAAPFFRHDGTTASSSSKSYSGIVLTLHVPAYGAVMMNPPDESDLTTTSLEALDGQPRNDQVLLGQLEIALPIGGGGRRAKAIQVGLQTITKLDLGPGRMGEMDTIFERRVEFPSGEHGIWLDEGSQSFEFTLILPATLAPHDWHGNGVVSHNLYAKIEGLPDKTVAHQSSIFSAFGRSRSPAVGHHRSRSARPASHSASASRSQSRAPSRPSSPPFGAATTSSLAAGTACLVLDDDVASLPRAPPYQGQDGQNQQGDDWLVGSYDVKRTIMLIYNPDKAGGVTELDERSSGSAAGLGIYELKISSDVFTICGLVKAQFTVDEIPSNVTIFCFRVHLAQTTAITSPRDKGKPDVRPVTSTRHFIIAKAGQRPPKGHLHPGSHLPALWKGKDAGGTDEGALSVEAKGRLPDDDDGRPSTLPGIITPIRVSHSMITEVHFSVYGETDDGKPMPMPGPGGLRVLKISRPIVVPSCGLVPQVLNLPTYENHQHDISLIPENEPCPLCKTAEDRLCSTCPRTTPPHPRHDHDPKVVGDPSGICPLCSRSMLPPGRPGWANCACGMSLEQMEERMRRNARPEWDGLGEEEFVERGRSRKEEGERGRAR